MALEAKDIISGGLSLLAIIVSAIIFYTKDPKNITPQTYILLVSILLAILLGSVIVYVVSGLKKMGNDIIENKKGLNDVKKSLDFDRLYNQMDVRLKVIETLVASIFNKKNDKKGQIDPRIIFWIILLILLYLLLKSAGVLK